MPVRDRSAPAVVAMLGRKGHKRISRIVTLPDFQGLGIGMRLVECVCEHQRGRAGDHADGSWENPAHVDRRHQQQPPRLPRSQTEAPVEQEAHDPPAAAGVAGCTALLRVGIAFEDAEPGTAGFAVACTGALLLVGGALSRRGPHHRIGRGPHYRGGPLNWSGAHRRGCKQEL